MVPEYILTVSTCKSLEFIMIHENTVVAHLSDKWYDDEKLCRFFIEVNFIILT